ncbi:hypothetical protein [Actinoplanes sp. NBRC 101535]|uniref:hypothetical protein n=1 Tax=Actinoplanes sp. NBRC 101535 TaxID=3032196 RepID=UPI0024A5D496|nr:hypothetical protein [Actinoplanes sp. NBRC 101535]GLY08317.1 hypothetical protein Acsp01_86960 [Actinoplanes sp. NBRC 101535]
MTTTADRPTTVTAAARPVADDAWLSGAQEPPADTDGRAQRGGQAGPRGQRAAVRPPARDSYKLRTRAPKAGCVWPLILLTGSEFSGKTTAVGIAAASGRFGRTWVLPFGEDPDQIAEYDPQARIVEHDGSPYEFTAAVEQIAAEINAQPLVDGKPQLVLVDSGSVLWDLFSAIAEARARREDSTAADLMRNPYASVNIGPLNWSAVNKMWLRIIRQLKSMQAVVVMTARGKDGVIVNAQGQIDNMAARRGEKTYRVAVQSETPYEAHAFVRLDREIPPAVLGVRVGRRGLRPGIDDPIICDGKPRMRNGKEMTFPPFSIEWLVFDLMRFDPAGARTAAVTDPKPDLDTAPDGQPPVTPGIPSADEAPGQSPPAETVPTAGRQDQTETSHASQ